MGSLRNEDLRALEELGLIPEELPDGKPSSQPIRSSNANGNGNVTKSERHGMSNGLPWFEEMIEGSTLGRVAKSRRAMGRSADGSATVEWEITEFVDDGSSLEQSTNIGKRKLEDIGGSGSADGDVDMKR